MTPEMQAKLRRSLVEHEGFRRLPYVDSVGKITIGIGYNLSDRGVSDNWINQQCLEDVLFFYNSLSQDFKWFQELNEDRQIVLVDMAFMGYKKLLQFEKMLAYLAQVNYDGAANEIINSEWANVEKDRAIQLSEGMRTGVYSV